MWSVNVDLSERVSNLSVSATVDGQRVAATVDGQRVSVTSTLGQDNDLCAAINTVAIALNRDHNNRGNRTTNRGRGQRVVVNQDNDLFTHVVEDIGNRTTNRGRGQRVVVNQDNDLFTHVVEDIGNRTTNRGRGQRVSVTSTLGQDNNLCADINTVARVLNRDHNNRGNRTTNRGRGQRVVVGQDNDLFTPVDTLSHRVLNRDRNNRGRATNSGEDRDVFT